MNNNPIFFVDCPNVCYYPNQGGDVHLLKSTTYFHDYYYVEVVDIVKFTKELRITTSSLLSDID